MSFVEFDSFYKGEHPCSTVFFSATKYIRKMKGGSQSILVQCDDDRFYVVKMAGNPQGSNVVANEFLGSVIAGAVGLPVAESMVIHLSDHFIDSEPDCWFELPSGRKRPDAGLHFGSLLVGQPSGPQRPSECISPSRINSIANRDAFLGMYILDVWANHQDNRQAVHLRRSDDDAQEALFIDHGHMFGGPDWNFRERPGAALHLESLIYSELWHDEVVSSWISHFRTVLPEVLSWVTSIVPTQWYNGDLRSLMEGLFHRLSNLTELVQKDATRSGRIVHQNSENDALRLSDFGIHKLRTPDTRSAFYRDLAVSYAKFVHSDRSLTQAMAQAVKTKKNIVDHQSKTFRAMTCRCRVNPSTEKISSKNAILNNRTDAFIPQYAIKAVVEEKRASTIHTTGCTESLVKSSA